MASIASFHRGAVIRVLPYCSCWVTFGGICCRTQPAFTTRGMFRGHHGRVLGARPEVLLEGHVDCEGAGYVIASGHPK